MTPAEAIGCIAFALIVGYVAGYLAGMKDATARMLEVVKESEPCK